MLVEFIIVSCLPLKETGKSLAKYIPMRLYQKKIFDIESILPEECVDQNGKLYKNFTVVKLENEYYKLKIPYQEIKDKYYKPLEIGGFNAKRSNYTNL